MRIAICSEKRFMAEDIKNIIECLNEEFEKFATSRLKWISKLKIESGRITSAFPFSAVFVYSKNKQMLLANYVVSLRY